MARPALSQLLLNRRFRALHPGMGWRLLVGLWFPLTLLVAAPVFAQERPTRPHRENRANPERTNGKEQGDSSDGSRSHAAPTTPSVSGQQVEDIQQSWMKEIGSPGSGGKTEATTDSSGAAPSTGAGDAPGTTSGQPGALFASNDAPSFLGLLLRFVVIAGLMGGGLYLFVRLVKKRTGIVNAEEGPVQVLASVPLMPGKFLQIVDMAGQIMVLGISESGVRLVHIVDSSVTAERIRLWHQGRPKDRATSLLQVIQGAVRRGEFRFWGGERTKDRPDFLEMLNGETTPPADVPPDRLSELLKEQHRKIRRSTEPGSSGPA